MKVLLCLALSATAISAGAALAQSAGAESESAGAPASVLQGLSPGPDAPDLRGRVERLGARARAHARRLGLRPARARAVPSDDGLLARRARRLRDVVGFLSDSRELPQAVDERTLPAGRAGGEGTAAGLRREYLRAARLAVTLGVSRPARLRMPAARAGRLREAARWRAVAEWLSARSERLRPQERPLSARVPHYEEFMCIARHESGARWGAATGNGYYGGLQMDRGFQQTYAPRLYRTKGTADHWTAEEQIRTAGRAVASRGFSPWPTTARACGLL